MSVGIRRPHGHPKFRDAVEKLQYLLQMVSHYRIPRSAVIILISRVALHELRASRTGYHMIDLQRDVIDGVDYEVTDRGSRMSVDIVVKLGWCDWCDDEDAPGPLTPPPRERIEFDPLGSTERQYPRNPRDKVGTITF